MQCESFSIIDVLDQSPTRKQGLSHNSLACASGFEHCALFSLVDRMSAEVLAMANSHRLDHKPFLVLPGKKVRLDGFSDGLHGRVCG